MSSAGKKERGTQIQREKVAILHPDLGLGGAERLIVDCAVELKNCGHEVQLYTTFHDVNRCFEETRIQRSGAFERATWVRVSGNWIPRQVCGKGHAVFAYLRCCFAALMMLIYCRPFPTVLLIDQVSAPILIFRMFSAAKIIFYCHYPDLLLAKHGSWLKALYRAPIDWLEERSTGAADVVLVNSEFTKKKFRGTFLTLLRHVRPGVLNPAVDPSHFAHVPSVRLASSNQVLDELIASGINNVPSNAQMFLSINRFERKKGLGLALGAFAELRSRAPRTAPLHLVVAGGYDQRLRENVEYLEELKATAAQLKISSCVTFVPSFSLRQRNALLARCVAVLYTPQDEHFGIVPLEAMAAGRGVIACDSGGPVETVRDGCTVCPA
ncbi:hypothetical protein CYMTET_31773 [Cymbomonas tetramitiformis]|uniref:Alpha-1,3/1,6-mannosyltransferase ALG2 n=1 Tax=Cymbomonas tetramitiformis TaxID=36881 RepID=A0AAE0FGM4_9CHLO|nr:hypothetical protein CYMTET_31773 [Cymbomonas tetramitiformis]